MAPRRLLFENNPIWKSENFSDLLFRALNIWNITRVVKAIVRALVSLPMPYSYKNNANVPAHIRLPVIMDFVNVLVEKTDSLVSLGGLDIISGSGGFTPRANAGPPSVTRFIQRI